MAFRWLADDGQTLNAVLVALRLVRGYGPTLLENPICWCFFGGGGGGGQDTLSHPPLDPLMGLYAKHAINTITLNTPSLVLQQGKGGYISEGHVQLSLFCRPNHEPNQFVHHRQ